MRNDSDFDDMPPGHADSPRRIDDDQVALLDPGHDAPFPHAGRRPRRIRSRLRTALILFGLTCLSTWFSGGIVYAVGVMSILLAHEMGHYLQSVRYHVAATFPYFIPMPISPFGTLGAIIFQEPGKADRKALFDIAISGPLAGLVLALPACYYGVLQSEVRDRVIGPNVIEFGEPLVVQWIITAVHGPIGDGQTLYLSALGFAGWVGIFITALNLIPIGQLDGGHILYTLIGRKAHLVAKLLIVGAISAMIYFGNMAYSIILILLLLTGPLHPPTADDDVPLGLPRVLLGWLTLAFIIIGFTPNPLTVGPLPESPPAAEAVGDQKTVEVEPGP